MTGNELSGHLHVVRPWAGGFLCYLCGRWWKYVIPDHVDEDPYDVAESERERRTDTHLERLNQRTDNWLLGSKRRKERARLAAGGEPAA